MMLGIAVDTDDFRSASTELNQLKTSLHEYKQLLESTYSQMQENWNGSACNAFADKAIKLISSYEGLVTKMGRLSEDIDEVIKKMQEADETLARSQQ